MKTIDVNAALRVYFGVGPTGGVVPYGGHERVLAHHGVDAAVVQTTIDAALDGLFEEREVRQLESLAAIAAFAEGRARARRPDLDADVCAAIGNHVAYAYR